MPSAVINDPIFAGAFFILAIVLIAAIILNAIFW